ncbi:rhodopsin-like isoform X2 [Leptopilina boulardi]|uniref:rhodopsin-like isoform X1 n=2 Tax=Leptopilina boulardi TaxID=63433 RepID=UPI0021F524A6|nr:rhodopsin-like isoform X1 [Leptopilina boulardi]XP_051174811.1 rhodopsin-like isoform X2 [Leptopilina boulardi]
MVMEKYPLIIRQNVSSYPTFGFEVLSKYELPKSTSEVLINYVTTTLGPHAAKQFMRFSNQTVVDKATEDMLHLIDPFWYQFPPLNPIWYICLGLVILALGIIGVCGNFVVVYIFLLTPSMRTPSNLLVINLAFSDCVMMFLECPPMIISCYYETWILGPLFCEIYALFGSLCGCASIWTMTAIAYDRYNVIVKGMAGTPLTVSRALIQIVIIWLFGLLWAILPMVGWNRYVPEGNLTACGTDYLATDWASRSYILVYSFFVYYLPLFTIIYSYYFIVATVAAHEQAMREQAKKMNVASLRSGEQSGESAEIKLAKVALTTIGLWFMAWTPYLVINYIGIFNRSLLTPLFTIWGSLFAKANAIYNPIVYGISHPKYRAALKEKLPFFVCGETGEAAPAAAANADTVSTNSKA